VKLACEEKRAFSAMCQQRLPLATSAIVLSRRIRFTLQSGETPMARAKVRGEMERAEAGGSG